ncbi:MAG TPA: DegV family protein [Candidatus Enterococcus avicola]|uniref:DegV family protein n=1 Tax=Candidatus Enterococcus avicola TaxID=2838561 RepID=A0A9D2JHK9_9ENTE|nr:DegV family protein [Candidatus Enterococcus avicola]
MNQEKIALLVDSGTDVPQDVMERYGIYMIPLQIIYKERTYTDKVDITPEEVYRRLEEEVPSTSLPNGAQIQKVLEKIKEDGYEKLLIVTISSGLSGTYNVLRLIGQEEEGLEVYVLDTKSIGIGAGLQAIRAAELIDSGLSFEVLIAQLKKEIVQNKVLFNVGTLEYLQKGGRIGLVTSIIGTALKLNPTISCNEDGVYYTVAKSRGRKRSIDKLVEIAEEFIGNHQEFRIAVAQGDAYEEGLQLKAKIEARFPNAKEILFGTISPALVVHTGPGLLGMGIQVIH